MLQVQKKLIPFLGVVAVALTLTACGGGSGNSSTPISSNSTSTVLVGMGDSPADWITSFGMTVNSIMLTNSFGGSVTVLAAPTQVEMISLMGTVQPVSLMQVPQGTYTSASINVSSVQIGYMDPSSHQFVQKSMAGPFNGTVNFSPAVNIGGSPASLNFDMNMASSVAISNGTVAITPTFSGMMNSLGGTTQNPWQGYMQHMVGSISTASSSQFTMNTMLGMQSATFMTNGSTQFSGMSGMGMMSNGVIVSVDAIPQSDGSLLAQHVEYMSNSSGMMGGGVITGITGNPPTQLNIVANSGMGGGMTMSAISSNVTVNVSSSTPYSIDSDGVDLANLPFTPSFDNTNIAKGQKIDVVSGGSMMGGGMMGGSFGTINAGQVELEQQGIFGTVSNYHASGTQASFTLTLPSDSAFTTVTGVSTITVYKQNETQMHNLTTIADGKLVQVRGLLFNDAGTYKLVTSWIVGS